MIFNNKLPNTHDGSLFFETFQNSSFNCPTTLANIFILCHKMYIRYYSWNNKYPNGNETHTKHSMLNLVKKPT